MFSKDAPYRFILYMKERYSLSDIACITNLLPQSRSGRLGSSAIFHNRALPKLRYLLLKMNPVCPRDSGSKRKFWASSQKSIICKFRSKEKNLLRLVHAAFLSDLKESFQVQPLAASRNHHCPLGIREYPESISTTKNKCMRKFGKMEEVIRLRRSVGDWRCCKGLSSLTFKEVQLKKTITLQEHLLMERAR